MADTMGLAQRLERMGEGRSCRRPRPPLEGKKAAPQQDGACQGAEGPRRFTGTLTARAEMISTKVMRTIVSAIASCSAAITNRNASQASLSSCSAIAIRSSASASLSVKRTSSNSNRIAITAISLP